MSHGLGKIEKTVLNLCQTCSNLKEKMISEGKWSFSGYRGGDRSYQKFGDEYVYSRILRTASRDIENLPENIIDLREVSWMYRKVKMQRFMEGSCQSAFARAVRSLRRKGYIVPVNQVGAKLRLIELDIAKCYVEQHNT